MPAMPATAMNAQTHDLETSSNTNITLARTVSWQSACGALATIALNTCLQNSGHICSIRKEFAPLVRSSPVFCLIDTLIVLFQLCKHSLQHGAKLALEKVASSRDQHLPNSISTIAFKRILDLFRGILRAVALLQTVKLATFAGLPWTQGIACCYIASYLVNAVLNTFGKPSSTGYEKDSGSLLSRKDVQLSDQTFSPTHILLLAWIIQLGLWCVISHPALPASLTDPKDPRTLVLYLTSELVKFAIMCPLMLAITPLIGTGALTDVMAIISPFVVFIFALMLIPLGPLPPVAELIARLFGISIEEVALYLTFPSMFLCCGLGVYLAEYSITFWVVDQLESLGFFRFVDGVAEYSVAVGVVLWTAVVSYLIARVVLFGKVADWLHLRHTVVASHLGFSCLFLCGANIVYGWLYYTVIYSPDDTCRPVWADVFGMLLY